MSVRLRLLAPLAVVAGLLTYAPTAGAHPEACAGKEGVAGSVFAFSSFTGLLGPGDDDDEFCFSQAELAAFDDSGATLASGETARTRNMHHLANLPKTGMQSMQYMKESNFNSDIAFWGKYAFQGNYNGLQITDISDPANPRIVSQTLCPGSQNDVSVWKHLVILSTDSRRSDDSCSSTSLDAKEMTLESEYWEGLKIFDWSDPAAPQLVGTVETDCGSHTHTILPQDDHLLVYVSSYDIHPNLKDCQNTGDPKDHDKISIVRVPFDDPAGSSVVAEPVLFPDGGFPGETLPDNHVRRETRGCHDITVFPAIDLAAGACMGDGIIMDISDPLDPQVIATRQDENFAFWHSATFFNDGKAVLFTDELGGGGQPTCNPTVLPERGANIVYDLSDPANPTFQSYFKIPRTQSNTENCVAHNGNFIPTGKSDTYVQAWYQGGTSVIDLDDPTAPREIGYFDRGPVDESKLTLAGSWSSYYYNGFIYSNDIAKGLDVFKFSSRRAAGAGANKMKYLNAQVQEPLRR